MNPDDVPYRPWAKALFDARKNGAHSRGSGCALPSTGSPQDRRRCLPLDDLDSESDDFIKACLHLREAKARQVIDRSSRNFAWTAAKASRQPYNQRSESDPDSHIGCNPKRTKQTIDIDARSCAQLIATLSATRTSTWRTLAGRRSSETLATSAS
jgi:hypothetical protein